VLHPLPSLRLFPRLPLQAFSPCSRSAILLPKSPPVLPARHQTCCPPWRYHSMQTPLQTTGTQPQTTPPLPPRPPASIIARRETSASRFPPSRSSLKPSPHPALALS